jgi:uncharacterized Zn-binding protein involved in type VI secretion
MAGNAVIVIGDPSSHGGHVITGSANMLLQGTGIARVGDMHSCPITGHGITPIVSSPSIATANGEIIAVTGAVAGCGAVISGSHSGFTA